MKIQLVKLADKFILVSDEEIKENNWKYCSESDTILQANLDKENKSLTSCCIYCKKIIAGIPELPSIDFSLLSEEDCKTIEWVDVEKLTEQEFNNIDKPTRSGIDKYSYKIGFIESFKTAQSLNDKMFSEDDIEKAIKRTRGSDELMESIIQSLQQTSWSVEVEMEATSRERVYSDNSWNDTDFVPKITNNSIKVIKIL